MSTYFEDVVESNMENQSEKYHVNMIKELTPLKFKCLLKFALFYGNPLTNNIEFW